MMRRNTLGPLKVFLFFSLALLLLFGGCSLFKKTTKTTLNDTQSTSKFSDFNILNVKTANKETSIFTYWDSGMVYQYQNIRERVDQVESAGIKTTDKVMTKKDVVIKESEPPVLWIYAGIGLLLMGILIVCWKR